LLLAQRIGNKDLRIEYLAMFVNYLNVFAVVTDLKRLPFARVRKRWKHIGTFRVAFNHLYAIIINKN